MKIHRWWPFAFGIIVIISVNSCTKTVETTKVDSLTVVDSVRDTVGRAWIRFVSMFPGNVATLINLYQADSTPFTTARNSCPNTYIPIRPDTSSTFYANIPSLGGYKLVPIPPLRQTMNTYGLFLLTNGVDSSLELVRSYDSEKFTPPPPGYCYFRMINGIADAEGPFFVDTGAVGNSLFFANGKPQSIPAFNFSYYALIPAGEHTFYLRIDDPSNPQPPVPFQTVQLCESGAYYTLRATGPMATGTIGIDQE